MNLPASLEIIDFFVDFAKVARGKVLLRYCLLVWHCAVCCLWKLRNGIIFRDKKVDMYGFWKGLKHAPGNGSWLIQRDHYVLSRIGVYIL